MGFRKEILCCNLKVSQKTIQSTHSLLFSCYPLMDYWHWKVESKQPKKVFSFTRDIGKQEEEAFRVENWMRNCDDQNFKAFVCDQVFEAKRPSSLLLLSSANTDQRNFPQTHNRLIGNENPGNRRRSRCCTVLENRRKKSHLGQNPTFCAKNPRNLMFEKCEFWEKKGSKNVNFVKNEILKMSIQQKWMF